MKTETTLTYWVHLWMSGPIEVAKQTLRQIAFPGGMCVTIDPTCYIYAGGEEIGFVVRFANYPRFPTEPFNLYLQAKETALALLNATFQHSVMVVTPSTTEWITLREQGDGGPQQSVQL